LPHSDAVHTVRQMKNSLANTIVSVALGGAVALGVLTSAGCDDDNNNDGTIPVDTGRGGTGGHAGHGGGGEGGGAGFGGEGGFAGGGGATAGHGGATAGHGGGY
jgi:hypothetical protein